MCGFFLSNYSSADATIDEIKDVLALRGTDHHLFQMEDFKCFHSRLVITGGEYGSQPLSCSSGCHLLVYNGELYGYTKLGTDLADGRVLVDLLCAQGHEALINYDLTFSGVVLNLKLGTMVIARDCLGKKPLYVNYEQGVGIAVSSARFRNGEFGFNSSNQRQIGAGETFVYDYKSRLMIQNYSYPYGIRWQIEPLNLSVIDEFYMGIENRLDGLPKNEDIHILFSGGIDSIILNKAIQRLGRRTRIYHLSSNTLDDVFCSKYEQWSGQRVERIRISEIDLFSAFQEYTKLRDITYPEYINPSGFTAFLLGCYFREKNISVVFSGDGADEVFCGYQDPKNYFCHEVFNERLYVEQIKRLQTDQFIKLDLAFAFNKVEVRSPFLTRQLRNLYRRESFQSQLKGGRPKEIVYQIARSLDIPTSLTDRKKEGFNVRIKREILIQAFKGKKWSFLFSLIKKMIREKTIKDTSWMEAKCY